MTSQTLSSGLQACTEGVFQLSGRTIALLQIASLKLHLNRILQAKYLGADCIVTEAGSPHFTNDAGNALAPEQIGRRAVHDLKIVNEGPDKPGAGMKGERNQVSHGRHA